MQKIPLPENAKITYVTNQVTDSVTDIFLPNGDHIKVKYIGGEIRASKEGVEVELVTPGQQGARHSKKSLEALLGKRKTPRAQRFRK